MTNIYHRIYLEPALESNEMYVELEELANILVKSGRLRIDTTMSSNCARVTIPELGTSLAFSKRELENKELFKYVFAFITSLWRSKRVSDPVEMTKKTINLLQNDMSKKVPISQDIELKIARLIVQSIHPVVIRLLLIDKVEFFLTYGYEIGDMLDVPTWKSSGQNSGMQTTDGRDAAVFISCGGDPLGETDKENPHFGDGKPAIARMMIIGAQEMGHFSDIMRDFTGKQISRYSTDFACTRAKENVRIARINDIRQCINLKKYFAESGIERLKNNDKAILFYKKYSAKWALYLYHNILNFFYKKIFIKSMKSYGIDINKKITNKDTLIGIMLTQMLDDMLFNLEPKADVYKRNNPLEEEAVACVEAIARVPQQVVKWGFSTTKLFMPNLYKVYYNEIIPGCIRSYEVLSNVKYKNKLTLPRFFTISKIFNKIKKSIFSIFKK